MLSKALQILTLISIILFSPNISLASGLSEYVILIGMIQTPSGDQSPLTIYSFESEDQKLHVINDFESDADVQKFVTSDWGRKFSEFIQSDEFKDLTTQLMDLDLAKEDYKKVLENKVHERLSSIKFKAIDVMVSKN